MNTYNAPIIDKVSVWRAFREPPRSPASTSRKALTLAHVRAAMSGDDPGSSYLPRNVLVREVSYKITPQIDLPRQRRRRRNLRNSRSDKREESCRQRGSQAFHTHPTQNWMAPDMYRS